MSASHRSARRPPQKPPAETHFTALLDFDGTVAPNDPTDRLLDRFAAPEWRDIEAEWQAGRMTSRECMARQAEMLRATPRQLSAAIRTIQIDPGFYAFLGLCRRRGVDVTIVSDGFDRVVRSVLRRAGLSVPFFANTLEWQGGDRWRLDLPHARDDCRSGAANCKCAHGALGSACIVVGDGRSDFCMAVRARFVIAKGALADFCRARGLAHASFRNFDDATLLLTEWLDLHAGWSANVPVSRRVVGAGPKPGLNGASGREPGV
jgi:2-hydroxy-3-keto-5-methylthiopentenyl-1-phosphate phosphatase